MISEQEIDSAVEQLRVTATEAAQRRANRLHLEHYLKTVLAQEQAKSHASSVAAAEVEARQSQAYLEQLDAYKIAVELDERAKYLRSALETKIDVWRTMQASSRKGVV